MSFHFRVLYRVRSPGHAETTIKFDGAHAEECAAGIATWLAETLIARLSEAPATKRCAVLPSLN